MPIVLNGRLRKYCLSIGFIYFIVTKSIQTFSLGFNPAYLYLLRHSLKQRMSSGVFVVETFTAVKVKFEKIFMCPSYR